jgi:hypothetical protein
MQAPRTLETAEICPLPAGSSRAGRPGGVGASPTSRWYLDDFFSGPKKPWEISLGHLQVAFGLADYWMPLSPVLEDRLKTDRDILLVSQDGLTGQKSLEWGAS